jgi:hypothetical protein
VPVVEVEVGKGPVVGPVGVDGCGVPTVTVVAPAPPSPWSSLTRTVTDQLPAVVNVCWTLWPDAVD